MIEPRIQYATTADGVSIAFWTVGDGTPLVLLPYIPFSHIQLEWQMSQPRRWYERLAGSTRMLVRYDGRGTGLSQRQIPTFSLDALVQDLEAVVDHLGLERFALFAIADSGVTAIAYAARHPELVSHLILWCTWARRADVAGPVTRALRAVAEQDWTTYTEMVARVWMGWSAEKDAHQFAAFCRECVTPEFMRDFFPAVHDFDASPFLSQVRCPTLVLHRRQMPVPDMNVVRALASGIPGARLALLEGASPFPFQGDDVAVLKAVREFFGEEPEVEAAIQPPAAEGLVTVLFTDLTESTTFTERLGDAKAQEVVRAHNDIVRKALRGHAGTEIKHTGDGIMASFALPSRAVECAITIQREVAAYVETNPDSPLRVHIGLNAGEPVVEERDLYGTAVQLARRICDRAQGGEILVSDVVRGLTAGKGFLFADRGAEALKGFEDPVRVYEVRWR